MKEANLKTKNSVPWILPTIHFWSRWGWHSKQVSLGFSFSSGFQLRGHVPCFTDAACWAAWWWSQGSFYWRILLHVYLSITQRTNKSQVNNASWDFRLTLVAQCVYFAIIACRSLSHGSTSIWLCDVFIPSGEQNDNYSRNLVTLKDLMSNPFRHLPSTPKQILAFLIYSTVNHQSGYPTAEFCRNF